MQFRKLCRTPRNSYSFSQVIMTSRAICMCATIVVSLLKTAPIESLSYYPPSPLKAYDAEGNLGHSTTLRCKLRTGRHNRGWFSITWSRKKPDGTNYELVRLPAIRKFPEWTRHATDDHKARLKPMITIQPEHVEFNLHTINLTCMDAAEYRCSAITPNGELVSMSELRISAKPQRPNVSMDLQSAKALAQGALTAKCSADVGIPAHDLMWYTREPDSRFFKMIEIDAESTEKFTESCRTTRIIWTTINVTEVKRGKQYRCGYPEYMDRSDMVTDFSMDLERSDAVVKYEDKDAGCETSACVAESSSTRDDDNGSEQNVIVSSIVWSLAVSAVFFLFHLSY